MGRTNVPADLRRKRSEFVWQSNAADRAGSLKSIGCEGGSGKIVPGNQTPAAARFSPPPP